MKTIGLLLVSILSAALVVACSDDDGEMVRIGVLLPLSGALESYGEASEAALEHARDEINSDTELAVELVIRDTETDPETALAMLEELHDDGIKQIVGPYSSSEVTAVQDYAAGNDVLLISPLSTAGTLAVPDDHIFRFTPDERAEGEAMAAVAVADGITTIVPVNRDDAGNAGLVVGLTAAFEAAGGTMAEGVVYAPDEADFESVAAEIADALEAAGGPQETTAIYLAAFSEVVDLFGAASEAGDELTSVVWYGSDSVALSSELISDDVAAEFATMVGYPNPILGLRDEDEARWGPVVEDLEDTLGRRPDSFALAAYDALVVGHLAIEEAGVDAEIDELATALVEAADNYVGLTGPTVLNAAGDRASASFDFWAVCPDGDGYIWQRTISYAVAADGTGAVIRNNC